MFHAGDQFPVKLFMSSSDRLRSCSLISFVVILFLFALQVFVDSLRAGFSCAHGKDNRSRACHSVSAGEYAFFGRLAVVLVGNDTLPAVRLQSFRRG